MGHTTVFQCIMKITVHCDYMYIGTRNRLVMLKQWVKKRIYEGHFTKEIWSIIPYRWSKLLDHIFNRLHSRGSNPLQWPIPEKHIRKWIFFCQAQPKPKPKPKLGAEIALISQLSWTTHHIGSATNPPHRLRNQPEKVFFQLQLIKYL